MKFMRGLYIGRFQPYHLGHQAVLEKIAKEVEEIVIVIGSAQESHTPENPFTGGERMEMIYAALSESDLRERCIVTPLQDIKRNSVWASHLQSMVPRFDVVYSNNPLVVQLIGEAGIQTGLDGAQRRLARCNRAVALIKCLAPFAQIEQQGALRLRDHLLGRRGGLFTRRLGWGGLLGGLAVRLWFGRLGR